jgi:hypothetical protein
VSASIAPQRVRGGVAMGVTGLPAQEKKMILAADSQNTVPLAAAFISIALLLGACKRAPEVPPRTPPRPITHAAVSGPTTIVASGALARAGR